MKVSFVMNRLCRFGLVLVFTFSCVELGYSQKPTNKPKPIRCEVQEKAERSIKYRIGDMVRTVAGPPTLDIYISVSPKYFNREMMNLLASRLNKEFCKEGRLAVLIFDDYRSARDFVPHTHSPTYDRDMASWRGTYELDRQTGNEIIKFSTERGKPRDEMKIELGKLQSRCYR